MILRLVAVLPLLFVGCAQTTVYPDSSRGTSTHGKVPMTAEQLLPLIPDSTFASMDGKWTVSFGANGVAQFKGVEGISAFENQYLALEGDKLCRGLGGSRLGQARLIRREARGVLIRRKARGKLIRRKA